MSEENETFRFSDPPEFDEFLPCIKCGLCLQSCPTYQETGLESESPRGRVQLIASVARGLVPLEHGRLEDTLFNCLDCRACEVACPSGVPIGTLIEKGRGQVVNLALEDQSLNRGDKITRLALRTLFQKPRRLERLGQALRLAQRASLTRLSPKLKFLPRGMRKMASSLRPIPKQSGRQLLKASPTSPAGDKKAQLFLGCVMDVLFSEANAATKRVLERNGCQVTVPNNQVCCGALSIHAGDREGARDFARRNIDAFLDEDADYIATNAGGCGAALLEYPEWLKDDPAYRDKARQFSERIRDAGQIVEELGLHIPAGHFDHVVTYQASCHLHNVMKVGNTPERLIRSVAGVDYRPMTDMARCCGSAGIYNLTHPEMSERLLERKMDDIPDGTEYVVTGNPGCWLQMEHGAKTIGPNVQVLHLMELLDRAYKKD